MMSVLVSKAFFFSPRISFFWEALRGKLSCFHVKGMLLCVCFPGCLKLFTVPGGLSVSVCICVYLQKSVWGKTPNRGWCKNQEGIWHLSLDASLYQVEKYSVVGAGHNLTVAYLSLITKSCHWSLAKCWHKISQMCTWPFWVSHSRAGPKYKSWQSVWGKLFLLDISGTSAHRFLAFQSMHQEKMSPFLFTCGNSPIKCDFKARPW